MLSSKAMPFRYHEHLIQVKPCPGRPGLYFAEVFGPIGDESSDRMNALAE